MMPAKRIVTISLFALLALSLPCRSHAAPAGQAAQLPAEEQHQHQHGHEMNTPSGASDKCEPHFTNAEGLQAPSHWAGVCGTGRMQTPIDITKAEQVPIPPLPPLEFSYKPADLDVVNDCNDYRIKLRFPDNLWLKVARKPYRLSEIYFHEPGENAVNGKRSPMSIEMVHLSPESTFLVIEVPIVEGKENPVIKTVLEHIPAAGREHAMEGVKINPMDLLPADHGFYRFPGSLTTPICNEGVTWFLMKNPIEMSKAQISQYKGYYHNTARPLQPLNNRPVVESK
jgi:carbonic anhydrase